VARSGAFKDRPLWRRLQAIHHAIKERRFPNASSLASELGVSSKTVQRDLDYLRDELDAPIEFDRLENGYVYSRPDFVLPFLPVDGKDLFSIGVAAQFLQLFGGTPLGADLKGCYERLAHLMPPAVRLRPEIVMEKLAIRNAAFRPVHPETWEAVSESLQRGIALSMRYHRPGEAPGPPRVIRPYAFVLSGRDWMVLAEDQAAAQVKLFYLARIEAASLTGERYSIPRDFDAEKFFRHTFGLYVGDAKPFRMRVRFSAAVSDEIRELQFHPDQKIETTPEGEAILEIPAQSVKEARRFVLVWGKDARVLEPPELAEDLRAEAEALARSYAAPAAKKSPPAKKKTGARAGSTR
jgi:proteasome accessory factor B